MEDRCSLPGVDLQEARTVSTVRRITAEPGRARRMRQEQRLSLRELAQVVGVTPGTLSRWENGRSQPRIDSAKRWAAALLTLQGRS